MSSYASTSADYFRVDDLQRNLGKRTAHGGLYTLASLGTNFAVGAVGTILLTRQLAPDDFGLYGMVIFISGFAQLFVDWGFSRAVVQKPEITHEQVSTLFWLNLAISVSLGLIVAMSTPLVVAFYREPRLAPINLAMSLLYLLGGLTMQHRALLQRRMEFKKLNAISMVAPALGTACALVVAFSGGGYWALVCVPAVTQLVTCLGVWRACHWRPGWPHRHTGVRQLVAFGGHVTAFQAINYLFRNADNAMIGFMWGSGPLGLYTRAFSLMMLPASKFNTPITQVIVPALSRLQHQPSRYRDSYQRAIRLVAAITVIPITMLLLVAPELLPILLGERWKNVVPVFMALGPAAVMAGTNIAGGWLYLSCGHVHRQTKWAIIAIPFLFLPIVFALPYGVLVVAIAVSVSRFILQLPAVAYACRDTPVRLRDYVEATFFVVPLPVMAACSAGLIYSLGACQWWGLDQNIAHLWQATTLPPASAFSVILFKLTVMVGLLLCVILQWPSARRAYVLMLSEWKLLRNNRQPAAAAIVDTAPPVSDNPANEAEAGDQSNN